MIGVVKKIGSGAAMFVQALLGVALLPATYIASYQMFAGNPALLIFLFPLVFLALMFTSTFVHELGHAFAAARFRWGVDRFVVWPLVYVPRKKMWSVDLDMPRGGDLLGWVETHPVGMGGSRREETWILAGGGIANLLAASAAMVLAEIFSVNPVNDVLHSFAVFSIVDAIVNLMPWRVRSRGTDGLRIWQLWNTPKVRPGAGPRPGVKGKGSQWNTPRKW